MNADDKYQHADRESRRHKMCRDTDRKRHVRRHHNRHIEHIDFHIEYTFIELCAFLMFPNVPMWCKNFIELNINK